jgi:hypothetical protein
MSVFMSVNSGLDRIIDHLLVIQWEKGKERSRSMFFSCFSCRIQHRFQPKRRGKGNLASSLALASGVQFG